MITIPFFYNLQKKQVRLLALTELDCDILEIGINQNYQSPEFPLDNSTFVSDTIWKEMQKINVEVLVNNANLAEFKANIESANLSDVMFTVESVNQDVFNNLKIEGYSYSINQDSASHTRFSITCKQFLLVQALVESYEDVAKPSYANKKSVGTKNTTKVTDTKVPETRKKTALKGWFG